MKESYAEGLASYGGPESCVRTREGVSEALAGVRAGRVLSREIDAPCREVWADRGAEAVEISRRPHRGLPHWRGSAGPRAVTDPVQARKHLAREPGGPAIFCTALGSVGDRAHRKAQGRTAMRQGRGKSDCCVVPKKRPNKAGGQSPQR